MQATGIAVPADQGIAVGIKEQQLRRKTFRQILHRLLEDLRDSGMLRTSMLTAAEILRSASDRARSGSSTTGRLSTQ